jgi:hypothetical protein
MSLFILRRDILPEVEIHQSVPGVIGPLAPSQVLGASALLHTLIISPLQRREWPQADESRAALRGAKAP